MKFEKRWVKRFGILTNRYWMELFWKKEDLVPCEVCKREMGRVMHRDTLEIPCPKCYRAGERSPNRQKVA